MKSGKSLELLARMKPYEYTDQQVLYVQPKANVRDKGVRSRVGAGAEAIVAESLGDITEPFDVIGIDEIHMFKPEDVHFIDTWIKQNKLVCISGLDIDYSGTMPEVIRRLIELKPEELVYKLAVCDVCKQYRAQFTQILHKGKPVLTGLPSIVPEDGTYDYQARCRTCFVKK